MLAMMSRAPHMLRLVLALFLAFAPLTSPVFAFSGQPVSATTQPMPCDMPCSDCEGEMTPECLMMCAAVSVTGLPVEPSFLPAVMADPVDTELFLVVACDMREPDEPPPREALA